MSIVVIFQREHFDGSDAGHDADDHSWQHGRQQLVNTGLWSYTDLPERWIYTYQKVSNFIIRSVILVLNWYLYGTCGYRNELTGLELNFSSKTLYWVYCMTDYKMPFFRKCPSLTSNKEKLKISNLLIQCKRRKPCKAFIIEFACALFGTGRNVPDCKA